MPFAVAGAAVGLSAASTAGLAAAGVAAAGSIGGALIGAGAQSSAASKEQQAELDALQFQKGVYGTAQGNLNPFIKTGQNALYSLSSLYGLGGAPGQPNTGQGAEQGFLNYTNTPAYQFPLQQGELAANRGLAATGLSGSGAAAKALTQYGQGYASQGFNSYISQLAGLAGLGQTSASSLGGIGTGVGSQVGSSYGQYGAAGAAGTIGSTGSILGGLQGSLGALTTGGNNSVLASLLGGAGSSSAYTQPSDQINL